jgi:hypothetical protein
MRNHIYILCNHQSINNNNNYNAIEHVLPTTQFLVISLNFIRISNIVCVKQDNNNIFRNINTADVFVLTSKNVCVPCLYNY